MGQNFVESRRGQGFLLPPDVREWLPPDHLAWFVIEAVAEMDLSAFYVAYRADGHGRAAYEPSVMVALILYAFATNVRSSRAIERHCRQDVAYRVIMGNLIPDHATVARFICRHEQALAGLFGEVLKLCDWVGLAGPGVVSIDGTRIAGNASPEVNRTFEQIAREILAKAKATDEAEDELYGDERGDELPAQLRTPQGGAASSSARSRESVSVRKIPNSPTPTPGLRRRPRLSSMRRPSLGAGARAAMPGCGRASASSSSTVGRTPTTSRADGQTACCWRPSDWNQTTMSNAAPTLPMSITGRPRATGSDGV